MPLALPVAFDSHSTPSQAGDESDPPPPGTSALGEREKRYLTEGSGGGTPWGRTPPAIANAPLSPHTAIAYCIFPPHQNFLESG